MLALRIDCIEEYVNHEAITSSTTALFLDPGFSNKPIKDNELRAFAKKSVPLLFLLFVIECNYTKTNNTIIVINDG